MLPLDEPFREVAGALILGDCGRMLFQQRDDVPHILYPGMIGLFGGHFEAGETALDCVRREIGEEIGVFLPPTRFTQLATLNIGYPLGGGVNATYFLLEGIKIGNLTATEGAPLVVEPNVTPGLLYRMTPTACFATRLFMLQYPHRFAWQTS